MRYEDDFKTFDKAKDTGIGDFVILTRRPNEKKISEILNRMDIHNKGLQSMKADVMMVIHNIQLNVSDTFTGNVSYLPKNNKHSMYARVNWVKPVEEQIVQIGEDYELYRPRLNQVIRGTIKKIPSGGALDFMHMTKEQLKASYSIAYIGEDQLSGNIQTWHLEITPKTTTTYKTAEAWVDSDGMPRQVKVNEQDGDSTSVLLSNIQKNVTLNAEIFKLKYPSTVKRIKA